MDFTTTKRGARALIYRGHRYVINRRGQDGRIFWRCGRSRSCSGSITTMDDNILSQRDVHNHEPDEDEIAIEKIVSNMKVKAMETTRPIPAIYHDAIQEIASMNNKDDPASKMPTFDQCKTSLYDSRREHLPTIPESRGDVHFNDKWVKTPSGEPFLIAEDGDEDDKLKKYLEQTKILSYYVSQIQFM